MIAKVIPGEFDIGVAMDVLADTLGLDKSYIKNVEITPRKLTVLLFKGREGRCKGSKYIDKNGDAATEQLVYVVRT